MPDPRQTEERRREDRDGRDEGDERQERRVGEARGEVEAAGVEEAPRRPRPTTRRVSARFCHGVRASRAAPSSGCMPPSIVTFRLRAGCDKIAPPEGGPHGQQHRRRRRPGGGAEDRRDARVRGRGRGPGARARLGGRRQREGARGRAARQDRGDGLGRREVERHGLRARQPRASRSRSRSASASRSGSSCGGGTTDGRRRVRPPAPHGASPDGPVGAPGEPFDFIADGSTGRRPPSRPSRSIRIPCLVGAAAVGFIVGRYRGRAIVGALAGVATNMVLRQLGERSSADDLG